MAKITVKFNDGTPDYVYQDDIELEKAKKYAHSMTTGRGIRIPVEGKLVYKTVNQIAQVDVAPTPEEQETRPLNERRRRT